MADLIDRQTAIDVICMSWCGCKNSDCKHHFDPEADESYWCDGCSDVEILEYIPSAEPERKKGRWQITDAYPHNVYCSECHVKVAQTHWAVWEDGSLPRNYCPNCGAEMG